MLNQEGTPFTLATGGLPNPLQQKDPVEVLAPPTTRKFLPEDRDTWLNMTVLPEIDKFSDKPDLNLQLKERYKFVEKLGEGASGEVELVLDLDILRLVALKRLHKDASNVKQMLGFINEIRIVGHLEHPNIVPIHDVGRDSNGSYYFVMKYTPGETLQEIIERLKKGHKKTHIDYPFAKRIEIFKEILKAVSFAHFHGIIHRDIKPANIIIGKHGEVTLMDWGIAKFLSNQQEKTPQNSLLSKFEKDIISFNNRTQDEKMKIGEKEGTVLGTFAYMAPEQAQGKNSTHDQRTDIYALSALLYEFLCLKSYVNLEQESVKTLLKAICEDPVVPPNQVKSPFQPTVPADISHFVMHGLRKDPDERHQSVKAMQEWIRRIEQKEAPVECVSTFSQLMITRFVQFLESAPTAGLSLLLALATIMVLGIYALFTGFTLL